MAAPAPEPELTAEEETREIRKQRLAERRAERAKASPSPAAEETSMTPPPVMEAAPESIPVEAAPSSSEQATMASARSAAPAPKARPQPFVSTDVPPPVVEAAPAPPAEAVQATHQSAVETTEAEPLDIAINTLTQKIAE